MKPLDTARQQILDEASKIVHIDRNASYGAPEDNFRDIAMMWSTFKGVHLTAMDVAVFMMLVKIARLKNNPQHHDSLVDIVGYGACAGEIQAWVERTSLGASSSLRD